jgi:hypothetical protein
MIVPANRSEIRPAYKTAVIFAVLKVFSRNMAHSLSTICNASSSIPMHTFVETLKDRKNANLSPNRHVDSVAAMIPFINPFFSFSKAIQSNKRQAACCRPTFTRCASYAELGDDLAETRAIATNHLIITFTKNKQPQRRKEAVLLNIEYYKIVVRRAESILLLLILDSY